MARCSPATSVSSCGAHFETQRNNLSPALCMSPKCCGRRLRESTARVDTLSIAPFHQIAFRHIYVMRPLPGLRFQRSTVSVVRARGMRLMQLPERDVVPPVMSCCALCEEDGRGNAWPLVIRWGLKHIHYGLSWARLGPERHAWCICTVATYKTTTVLTPRAIYQAVLRALPTPLWPQPRHQRIGFVKGRSSKAAYARESSNPASKRSPQKAAYYSTCATRTRTTPSRPAPP